MEMKKETITCPRYLPSLILMVGGCFEIALFSISKEIGFIGIIPLTIGAYILWK